MRTDGKGSPIKKQETVWKKAASMSVKMQSWFLLSRALAGG